MPNLSYELYDKKIALEFDPERHWYFVNGAYVPSVTGITKYLDKSGPLMVWATRTDLNWLKDQLKPGEVVDEVQLDKLFKEAGQKHKETVQSAATLGGMIHEWVEKYIKFKLGLSEEPAEPINVNIKNGALAFLDWEKENKVEYLYSERKVYSAKYGYAGTVDCLGKLNDKLAVIDLKTGSGPWYEHVLQTAGYQQALEEELGVKIKERWILKVDKETGKFHAHKATLYKEDLKAFLALLEVNRRHKFGILTKEKQKYYGRN